MAAQAERGKGRSLDALGKAGTQAHLEVVDRDVVEHRVWARQVDVLEDAGVDLPRHALLAHQLARLCVTCAVCSGPRLHGSLVCVSSQKAKQQYAGQLGRCAHA